MYLRYDNHDLRPRITQEFFRRLILPGDGSELMPCGLAAAVGVDIVGHVSSPLPCIHWDLEKPKSSPPSLRVLHLAGRQGQSGGLRTCLLRLARTHRTAPSFHPRVSRDRSARFATRVPSSCSLLASFPL